MKKFAESFKKESKNYSIGISENQAYRCFSFEYQEQRETYWQLKTDDNRFTLPQAIECLKNPVFIRSVPFQYIWRKYLFLPINYDQAMIYRQILQVLRQELPLAIEEVYFDYQCFPLPNDNLVRVIIYALRKNYADSLFIQPNTILDCELYCFVRGFNYLSSSELAQQDRIYALENKTFKLTPKGVEFNTDLTQANCHLKQLELPDSITDPVLYLTALGASLWNGEE
ncbi:type IV pilus biogenesis protein PilM [Actinobacillus pleuropneumoniae]|uniref:pilus assembly protein PilM n=1 Tax=Actinobacillus pleuropneumoniae TaxID=715 RepID=UPI00223CFAE2|nr:pilus assembly protein PilM [Actinobacillus pleuropneumoniae]